MQPDLFRGHDDLAVDATFAAAHRTLLDGYSWIDVVPGWVSGSEALIQLLGTAIDFRVVETIASCRW